MPRDKKTNKPTRKRRWQVKGICRSAILRAIDFYATLVALPPAVSGKLPPKGHKFSKTQKYGLGLHKNQQRLVSDDPDVRIDIQSNFLFIVTTYYCYTLEPPVEQGTEGAMAVFKVLTGLHATGRLLRTIKNKFQVASTTYPHDIPPRHASTTCLHDIPPRHASTTCLHDIPPRRTPP